MTHREAVRQFRADLLPELRKLHPSDNRHGVNRVAARAAWGDWTDSLCKDGQITQRQYDRWLSPIE